MVGFRSGRSRAVPSSAVPSSVAPSSVALSSALAVVLSSSPASAQSSPPSPGPSVPPTSAPGGPPTSSGPTAPAGQGGSATDEQKAQALAKYLEGVELVKKAQWSDALAAFETSMRIVPNPATTLNIGACERALGRYVRARATLTRALAESAARGGSLPESSVVEARAFLAEMDRVIATAVMTVEPPGSSITIDGRPLAPTAARDGGTPRLAAGVAPPGLGGATPARSFEVVLDPGAHVITLSRKGFADVVVNRTFAPGTTTSLELRMDELPATLKVTSSEKGAIVRVGERDVGPAPVDVLRPPGSYRVVVDKDGFLPYETQVTVKAGEEVKLDAALALDEPSVLERWWFWAGAVTVIAGGAVITYALTRPEPAPPPYDGGSTGWVVQPTGVRF